MKLETGLEWRLVTELERTGPDLFQSMTFEVFTAVKIRVAFFLFATPWSVIGYQRFTLKMEAAWISEILTSYQDTTRRYNQKEFDLFHCTIMACAWRVWGESWNLFVRIVSNPVKILSEYVPIRSLELHEASGKLSVSSKINLQVTALWKLSKIIKLFHIVDDDRYWENMKNYDWIIAWMDWKKIRKCWSASSMRSGHLISWLPKISFTKRWIVYSSLICLKRSWIFFYELRNYIQSSWRVR